MRLVRFVTLFFSMGLLSFVFWTQEKSVSANASVAGPIRLSVDASDARRKLFHAHLTIPATPGAMTLVYPKWIPGEHEPSGPINNLVDLSISAHGQPVSWRRDETDMYAFHFQVPDGADSIDVDFAYASPLTTSNGFVNGHNVNATDKLAMLNWNSVLLYPLGAKASDINVQASLRVPDGWKYATALDVERERDGAIEFQPVSLERLIDSPVMMGAYFRSIDLTPGRTPDHILNLAADSPEALNIRPEILQSLKRLPDEAQAVFGPGHYRKYNFLLALSDHIVYFGLEHHESSDDRIGERTLIDESAASYFVDLLPHEFTHSWNGKYRRPAGLATPDYQEAMRSDMLWVYEGLTEYYGVVLGARIGLGSPEWFHEDIARIAAYVDNNEGRKWRPLEDTAIASQLIESSGYDWASRRRSLDYYEEGLLIWLEADSIIRRETKGAKTLDDFAHAFLSGDEHAPSVRPYTFDDIVSLLDKTAHYDWRTFLDSRVRKVTEHPPMTGIESDGWRLEYTDTPGMFSQPGFTYSLGLFLYEDGTVGDIRPETAADHAGLGQGMKVIAINGRQFTTSRLHEIVARSKTESQQIELLVESGEYFRTIKLDYRGGERYPHLVRDDSKLDVLADVIKSKASFNK